ncbi:hypothetical protein [Flaviaesturariibacter terrae]
MRRLLLFCLLLIPPGFAAAQDLTDSFWKDWERLLRENRYAELARLVRVEAERNTDSSKRMLFLEAAHTCEIHAAAIGERKALIRAALYDGSFSKGQKREWGVDLAEYYLAECRYDSALYILDYALHIPEQVQRCFGPPDFPVRYRHAWMLALQGIGNIDSAIRVFAPAAFLEKSTLFYLTTKDRYEGYVADFVRLLRRRYSPEELAAAAEDMIRKSGFRTETVAHSRNGEVRYIYVYHLLGAGYDYNGAYFVSQSNLQQRNEEQRTKLRTICLYRLLRASDSFIEGL